MHQVTGGNSSIRHPRHYLVRSEAAQHRIAGCKNPFAPSFDETDRNANSVISDQKTTDGVFQNFQYAYAVKDTSIYGNLLTGDFTFTYRDYDQGFDVSWGRDEDMKTTYGLFENAQQLEINME